MADTKLKLQRRTPLLLNKYIRVFEDWFEGYDSPYYIIRLTEPGRNIEIVAFTADKKILLVSKPREAARKMIYSLPGGRVEHNQTPQVAAKHELIEETGYRAKNLIKLGGAYISPARVEDLCFMFFARVDYMGKQKTADSAESKLKCHTVSLKDIMQMIRKGRIQDMTSIAAILLAKERGLLQ